MNVRMKLAFACYFVALLVLAGFGFVYLFRTSFMPYHAVAVGMPWGDVPSNFQVLILALMKVTGSGFLTIVIIEYILLFIPFRQGAAWARWAIPLGGILICGGTLYVTLYVATHSPANPPWYLALAGFLFFPAGFILSLGQEIESGE